MTIAYPQGTQVSGAVLNVTVTDATQPSFLTLWPDGATLPLASDLNFSPGPPVPNLVVVKVGSNLAYDVYNQNGSVDVVIDEDGRFTLPVAPLS